MVAHLLFWGDKMKKYISLALCLCVFLSFIGCKGKTDKPINEESNLTGEISDSVEFRVHDDNSKIWLDNLHIEKISVETDNEGKKILVFTTTEEGKTILFNATNENIGKPLSVSADKHLLFSPTVVAPIEDGLLTFNSTLIDFVYLYNYLTDAKDKMKDVTPPENLISEETAKNKVFERAGTTADNVTQLSIELKIDEAYFGWKYCINFTTNNKEYTSEVNAHTGGIIKFTF